MKYTYMWAIRLFKRKCPRKVIPVDTCTQSLSQSTYDTASDICKSEKPMCGPMCRNDQCVSIIQEELMKLNLER